MWSPFFWRNTQVDKYWISEPTHILVIVHKSKVFVKLNGANRQACAFRSGAHDRGGLLTYCTTFVYEVMLRFAHGLPSIMLNLPSR